MIDLFKNVSFYIIFWMYTKTIEWGIWYLEEVPDCFKTKKMCERIVEKYIWRLKFVPDHLKTQGMCERAVEKDP